MSHRVAISRRTILRGLGTAVALPWLEAMSPVGRALAEAANVEEPPLRMAFFYIPNGAHMQDWTPATEGALDVLPHILEPLAARKDDLLVLSGLAQANGFAKGDGPGDHARSLASFLTGAHPRKTNGAAIKAGISVDQIGAQSSVGARTRFASIELGIDRGAQSGNCDSGYSCAYSSNISWRSDSVPNAKEVNPRLVFDRLFGGGSPGETAAARGKRERRRSSILDFVGEDAAQLQGKLGANDRRKVDEYLNSVRELEVRVAHAANRGEVEIPEGQVRPTGLPQDYAEHVRLMLDMMVLAFRTDTTRIGTFMFANETSGRSYPNVGVSEGHHEVSHHAGNAEKHDKIRRINRFHIELFAGFLDKLKALPEGEAGESILDRSMIVYGSGIGDGNRHNHDDLPILLAGKGGGTIATGRHVVHGKGTPLNNLYLSMLDRFGAPIAGFGDSKGRLPGLDG